MVPYQGGGHDRSCVARRIGVIDIGDLNTPSLKYQHGIAAGQRAASKHRPTKQGSTDGPKTKASAAAAWLRLALDADRPLVRHTAWIEEARVAVPSPLIGLKKPPPQPRLSSFTTADEKAIYAATDKPFRDFLFIAIHTGLRPFCELARLTADDVEELDRGMMWRVYSTKTKKTRKIPVRPEVAMLMRKLIRSAPVGSGKPLLRNAQGNPWKKGTGVSRFLKVKRELGWDIDVAKGCFSTYTCRHMFAHRMLSGYWNNGEGCAIETLAELMGDTPKVAFDHYGKEWGQHYQEPLWAAVGM